jgi:surface polysaccharide O-acyltransferase-like enzyme
MVGKRDYALDNLRTLIIFLVVVLHASLCYMAYAPKWWYVLDPERSIVFTQVVLVIDVPIMLIMFFLAGYFAYPSLVHRGSGAFLKDKLRRIGIPWVFGVLVLAPPTAYMIYYSRHSPMSLLTFWQTDFWGPAFQQSVYWYLGILMALFLVTAALYAANPRFAAWKSRPERPTWRLFTLFLLVMSATSILVGQLGYGLDQWTHVYLFTFQPVRTPLYIGYFALGLYAGQRQWFQPNGYAPGGATWVGAAFLSGLIYLAARMAPPHDLDPTLVKGLTIILFNLFCFASLLGSVALCRRYLAGGGGLLQLQARNSYAVYYLHPLVLYPLAFILVPLQWPIFVKFVIATAVTYLLSLAVGAGILTRMPGLRRMF